MVLAIDSNLVGSLVGEQVEISLQTNSEEARQSWQRAHQAYTGNQRDLALTGLISLFCLLFIAFLAVCFVRGIGSLVGLDPDRAGAQPRSRRPTPLLIDLSIGVVGLFIPIETPGFGCTA